MSAVPAVRAFAVTLCGNPSWADDLAQETLLRAWAHKTSYTLGTNIKAWLFTILRNVYYSASVRRSREIADPDGYYANTVAVGPDQEYRIQYADLTRAFATLPYEQREAVTLVAASGLTYEEAAKICGVAVGTIKSRVSRARSSLSAILDGDVVDLERLPGSTSATRHVNSERSLSAH
jgi:RNA polymerase sigma-70 factor (ECF subfamily)